MVPDVSRRVLPRVGRRVGGDEHDLALVAAGVVEGVVDLVGIDCLVVADRCVRAVSRDGPGTLVRLVGDLDSIAGGILYLVEVVAKLKRLPGLAAPAAVTGTRLGVAVLAGAAVAMEVR